MYRNVLESKGLKYQYLNSEEQLLGFLAGKKAILTNGIVKKTQKTPRAALRQAKKYRSDYIRRNCHDQL